MIEERKQNNFTILFEEAKAIDFEDQLFSFFKNSM